MKKRIFLGLIGIFILSLAIVGVGCGKSDDNDADGNKSDGEKVTVTIGKVPYVDMWPAVYIIKNVAEELGFGTEIIEADMGFMFQGVAQGNIDIFPDVCLPILHQSYMDKYEGQFELVGTAYKNGISGWAVPAYVDIDSITELKGRSEEFGDRIVGIEPSSGAMLTSEEMIEAYELNEYTLLEGSTPAMLAEVEKATKNKEPIVFLSWRPNTMWINYDLKMLEDPKGICVPYDSKTAISNDLKEKAADLYQLAQNFEISIDKIEQMLREMEEEDKDIDILAKEWIEENRALVDEMLGK